jgi:transposase
MKKTADGSKWRKGIRDGFESSGEVSCERCFSQKLLLDELRAENIALKAKIKYLERGESAKFVGAHTPSSQRPFKGKTKESGAANTGGAQIGHKGSGRCSHDSESADEVIEVPAPKYCSSCQGKVNRHSQRERSVLDVTELKVRKILYTVERGRCSECKKLQESRLPLFTGSLYSNALLSQIAVLHYLQGIPIGRICDMLGASVNPGSIFTAMHRIAKRWEPALEGLREEYRQAPVKHADETGWRVDGQPGWSWLFCSATVSLFECQDTRSARVPARIFGDAKLPGVLVVDRFSAYNKMPCEIQYCYAHLLREVKKMGEEFPENAEVHTFASELGHLLSEAMRLQGRSLTEQEYSQQAQQIAAEIQKLNSQTASHSGIQSIQRIFNKKESRFFQWVNDRSVPTHNNRAERELRQTVIARKVSFGSQSRQGAKTRSTLMSILTTAKKRLNGESPEVWFTNALNHIALDQNISPHSLLPQLPP